MGIRSNGVVVDHGDPTAIDGAAVLSYVGTFRRLSSGSVPGITKNNLFLLYSPDADDVAGGQSGVWEYRSTDSALATDVDYRIAAVFDGSLAAASRWKMWVDAVAKTLSGSTPGTTLGGSAGANLHTAKTTTSAVDGFLADLKVWTAALTADEIIQETFSRRPVRTANLLIWSPYDLATDLRDYSGNGFHGTNASASNQQMKQVEYGQPLLML